MASGFHEAFDPGESRTPIPSGGRTDFLSGLRTIVAGGDAAAQAGMASHVFVADASMDRRYFQNADGELLVVPQQGRMRFLTEFGILVAEPGEIVIIPRGIKLRVELRDGPVRGYVCENYGAPLTLPERGPISARIRRWLNHSTHSRVANSTASRPRHGPRGRITSVLYSPMMDCARALSCDARRDGHAPAADCGAHCGPCSRSTSTGRSAVPGRSARPRTRRGARR